MSNLLITSISNKVPLILRVKQAVGQLNKQMLIYGGDIDENIVGKYFIDEFWLMPATDEKNKTEIVNYLERNNIKYIVPTRDNELLFWAIIKEELSQKGIQVLVSNQDTINICLDKLYFYQYFSNSNINVIESSDEISEIRTAERFVIKERYGSGSRNILIDISRDDASKRSYEFESPIYQRYVRGKEYSVDMFIDRNGTIRGIVPRIRQLISNGESQVTAAQNNLKLEKISKAVAQHLQFYGHIILQFIKDEKDNYHLIECNPRFGGASTLSVEMGLNSFYWFLTEIDLGKAVFTKFVRPVKKVTQVRYKADMYIEGSSVHTK